MSIACFACCVCPQGMWLCVLKSSILKKYCYAQAKCLNLLNWPFRDPDAHLMILSLFLSLCVCVCVCVCVCLFVCVCHCE